ncbi:MAG: hypothetical protein WCY24_08930, partial [Lutispora sp.]
MKNLKLLWIFMKGNRLLYLASIISIGLATIFSFMSPLVIRYTIDSVIGGTAMVAPDWIINLIKNLGGQDILRQNIWICSLALVLLSIVNGTFTYFKGKWSAVASESIAQNIRDTLYDKLQNVS